MYKRILVPTDGSLVSEAAAGSAITLARSCGADIVALAVAVPEPVLHAVAGALVIDPGQQAEVLLDRAHGFAAAVAARARAAGVDCRPVAILSRDPARGILDAAREYACDLVVMGSHGRRGLSRLVAGSVTQAVLAYSPRPVMVFRPELAEGGVQEQARTCPVVVNA
jgi:nucleotide-binding universal stress UspA family protein